MGLYSLPKGGMCISQWEEFMCRWLNPVKLRQDCIQYGWGSEQLEILSYACISVFQHKLCPWPSMPPPFSLSAPNLRNSYSTSKASSNLAFLHRSGWIRWFPICIHYLVSFLWTYNILYSSLIKYDSYGHTFSAVTRTVPVNQDNWSP